MVFLGISRLHVGWLNYDPLLILAPLTRDNALARCTLIPSSSASLHSPVYMYAFSLFSSKFRRKFQSHELLESIRLLTLFRAAAEARRAAAKASRVVCSSRYLVRPDYAPIWCGVSFGSASSSCRSRTKRPAPLAALLFRLVLRCFAKKFCDGILRI